MFDLIKIDENDKRSLELLVKYRALSGNWRAKFVFACQLKNYYDPIFEKLDQLSDMEAIQYMVTVERSLWEKNQEFLFLKDNEPVANLNVIYREEKCVDLSVVVLESERQKGYATLAIEFLEEYLFRKEQVLFTTIIDLTKTGASTRIAKKRGYKFMVDTGYFIKLNPYLSLEEAKQIASQQKKSKLA